MILFNSIPGSIIGFVMIFSLVDRICRCIERRRDYDNLQKLLSGAIKKAESAKITPIFKENEEQ
jgi:hypothetical protein